MLVTRRSNYCGINYSYLRQDILRKADRDGSHRICRKSTERRQYRLDSKKEELARSLNDEAAGKIEDFESFFSDLIAGKYD